MKERVIYWQGKTSNNKDLSIEQDEHGFYFWYIAGKNMKVMIRLNNSDLISFSEKLMDITTKIRG